MKTPKTSKLRLNELPEGFDGDEFIKRKVEGLALAFGLPEYMFNQYKKHSTVPTVPQKFVCSDCHKDVIVHDNGVVQAFCNCEDAGVVRLSGRVPK